LTEPTSPPALGFDLEALRVAIWEHRVTAVVFFAAVVSMTLVGTLLSTPKFRAVALIHLMPRAGLEVAVEEVVRNDVGGYLEGQQRARTQIQIILSRSVLEEVLQTYRDLGYGEEFPTGPDAVNALSRILAVKPRENTQLVEIGVEHRDAERAAILANLIADVYSSFNLSSRTYAARDSKGWIDTRIRGAKEDMDAASTAALTFRQEHDLVDVEEGVNGVTARLNSLQAALGEATTQRVLLQSELDNYQRLLNRGEFLVLAGMFPADPTLDTMSRERASIVVESAEVLARYGENHPEHQRAVERMERVDSLLDEAVRRNIDGVRSQVRTLSRQEEQIAGELRTVKGELLERQRYQQQYEALKFDEERSRGLYDSLKARVTEVDLQAHSELNDVRIVDHAVAPTRPSSPNLLLNLAVAMMVGIFGGCGLAVIRHRFGWTLRRSVAG
jgi:succinoglycan biosynthesis transport protein ExoP